MKRRSGYGRRRMRLATDIKRTSRRLWING
jgi:hypothetical protein